MPDTLSDTLIKYVGARRSFTWALLGEDALESPVAEPTEEQLRAYYESNTNAFMLPDTKELTYVSLTPDMLLDSIDIAEDAVRQLYEDRRSSEYEQPERRLVERLVFADKARAESAMAQLEVSGTTFEQLVQDRGLQLSDIDMGDVTREDLGEAADEIFAADTGAVVGPLPSDLGPALYRINGQLAARTTAFEDVKGELRDELASERARRQIETMFEDVEDRLAGGATLEDVAQETELVLGILSWSTQSYEGIAAYTAFNAAATQVSDTDFPELTFLDDGGIFALRLDKTLDARPEPFEDARDGVAAAWTRDAVQSALTAQAEGVKSNMETSPDLSETGVAFRIENGLTRTAFLEGTPPDFMNQVFEMNKGEVQIVPSENGVVIVRLDDVLPPEDSAEMAQIRTAITEQMSQTLAQALFNAYARDSQLRAGARIDEQALNAVLSSFN